MGVQVWAYLPETTLPVTFVTFFDKIQGGSGEWVWGVTGKVTYFWNLSINVF